MKRLPLPTRLPTLGGLIIIMLLSAGLFMAAFASTTSAAEPDQAPPVAPSALPSAPPVPSQPSGPAPAPTLTAIPTIAAPSTPVPPTAIPPAPETSPTSQPLLSPTAVRAEDPAFVTVLIRSAPNLAAAPDDIVTLTIVATNRGKGRSSDTLITLPLSGLPLRVLDATPSRAGAWVSRLDSEVLEIRSGPLGSGGDTVSIAMRVQVLSSAPLGAALGARLAYSWSDKASGGAGLSNLPVLVVAAQPASAEIYSLDPVAGESAETLSSFTSPIFAPSEPVALWYDTPAGASLALGMATADADGQLSITIDSAETAAGRYTLVARGLWTEFTATASVIVP